MFASSNCLVPVPLLAQFECSFPHVCCSFSLVSYLLLVRAEPEVELHVGDLVLTGDLSSADYNGFVGEVKSGLIDGRYQVRQKRYRDRLSKGQLKSQWLRSLVLFF